MSRDQIAALGALLLGIAWIVFVCLPLAQPSDWKFTLHKPTVAEGLKAEWFDVRKVYAAAMLQASPVGAGDRGALRINVARIIDPKAWLLLDEERKNYPADPMSRFFDELHVSTSLAKADTILQALIPTGGEG